ncbi:CCA tRNA nucleotidyltransferase [Rhodobacteraceae bacterium NNCM2]|nr:CCA tRNA nucleotidyltransferase [Coraliihabitans acroporae]
MTRLEAEWIDRPATRSVMDALGGEAFFVGGCIRNTLLGQPVTDVDIATPIPPDEVILRLEGAGLRAVPTGREHGTITAVADGQGFEVTTFRRDVETDGRHAVVAFSTEMGEDAARRDFTLNALYADREGRVIDPLGGLDDLYARRVRFILDPEQRIREDALRILRFFRFTAWYAAEIDAYGLAACAALADLIDGLARERVGAEMRKLLAAPDPALSVAAMAAAGVLHHCLTGANPLALAPLVHREGEAGAPPDWMTRLAALGAEDASTRLRLSRAEARHLGQIHTLLDAPMAPAIAAAEAGREIATAVQLVSTAGLPVDWKSVAAEIERGAATPFPLTAGDLMKLGASPGVEIGEMLRQAREAWHDSDLRLTKPDLIDHLRAKGWLSEA